MLKRTRSLWLCLLTYIGFMAVSTSASAQDITSAIIALQIQDGPWKGAVMEHPAGAGFRYYFVSAGLRTMVREPRAASVIRGYLNNCLSVADLKTGLWGDVPNINSPVMTPLADADDSNAAMFILLASEYYTTPSGKAWWTLAVRERIKTIARLVLLDNTLSNGLVSAFSQTHNFDDSKYDPPRNPLETDTQYAARKVGIRASRKALQHSAYLMDSCEVWAALNGLANVLEALKDKDMMTFRKATDGVAAGVASLYNSDKKAFYILDTEKVAYPNYYAPATIKFYPGRMAQVFPELFQVPVGKTSEETKARYEAAWKFATEKGDFEAKMPADGSSSPYPVVLRGYMALKHGDRIHAEEILNWYMKNRSDTKFVSFNMIHEMGYAYLIQIGLHK